MKYLSVFFFLVVFLSPLLIKANVIYYQIQEAAISKYTIENPVGVQDINIEVKTGTVNMLIINTSDYLESIVLTKNFDELQYLECDDLIDDTKNYNVDGIEYDLGGVSGQEVVIGFRFPTVGNSFHYAWMKLYIGENGETFDFIEYAYEDLIDTKIVACDVGFVANSSVKFSKMYVYPNPAQEYIRISTSSKNKWTKAEIIDSKGILQKDMNWESELFIGDLANGMYQILFFNNNRLMARTSFLKI